MLGAFAMEHFGSVWNMMRRLCLIVHQASEGARAYVQVSLLCIPSVLSSESQRTLLNKLQNIDMHSRTPMLQTAFLSPIERKHFCLFLDLDLTPVGNVGVMQRGHPEADQARARGNLPCASPSSAVAACSLDPPASARMSGSLLCCLVSLLRLRPVVTRCGECCGSSGWRLPRRTTSPSLCATRCSCPHVPVAAGSALTQERPAAILELQRLIRLQFQRPVLGALGYDGVCLLGVLFSALTRLRFVACRRSKS
eukprot:280187-Rhodomonas_salina.5